MKVFTLRGLTFKNPDAISSGEAQERSFSATFTPNL